MHDDLLARRSKVERHLREALAGFTSYQRTCDEEIQAYRARAEACEAAETAALRLVATLQKEVSSLKKQHAQDLARKDREIKRLRERLELEEPDDSPLPPRKRRRSNPRVISDAEAEDEDAMDEDARPEQEDSARKPEGGASRNHGEEGDEVEEEAVEDEQESIREKDVVDLPDDESEYQASDNEDDTPMSGTPPPSPIRKSARLAKTAPVSYKELDPNALDDDDDDGGNDDTEDEDDSDDDDSEAEPQSQSESRAASAKSSESGRTTPSDDEEEEDEEQETGTPDTSVIDGDEDTGSGPKSLRDKCYNCTDRGTECHMLSGLKACFACRELHIRCNFPGNYGSMIDFEAGDGETVQRNG